MATYFSLRDGLLSDISTYGYSISSIEKTTNTTGYMLSTVNSWSTTLTSSSADIIDSIAIHLSSRAASPVGTLTLEISSRTVSPTTFGTYPISSFTSFDGSNLLASYPLNWQLLKLSSPFTNSTGSFRLNLKTSDSNQLSLIGLSTVNGIDYDRMALLSSISVQDLSASLTKTGTTLSADSPFGSGVDGSISFNGTSNYLTVPANRIVLGTSDFTIEMWINTTVSSLLSGNNRTLFYIGTTSAPQIRILINSANAAINVAASPIGIAGTITATDGTWKHVCLMRKGSNMATFINGVQSGNTVTNTSNITDSVTNSVYIGAFNDGINGMVAFYNGLISNLRVIKGEAIYPFSTFTPPAAPLNTYFKGNATTRFLYKSPYSNEYLFNLEGLAVNTIHVGGSLNEFLTQSLNISASDITLDNLYIHKGSTLTFPVTSTTLNVYASAGLMVTSEGTLQIGTSSNPVPANTTHQIVLSGNSLNVANGGRLDVYGAYKLPSTRLSTPTLSTTRTFTVVDDISSTWKVNDTLIFTPNTAQSTSYDELVLSSFDSNTTIRTTTSAGFGHSVLSYIPSVANLTRNVNVIGLSNSAKGTVAARSGAIVNINNTKFNFVNFISTRIDDTGTLSVSGCVLSGDGTNSLLSSFNTNIINSNFNNNTIYKARYGVFINNSQIQNSSISNNLILSSTSAGIYISNFSGIYGLSNNITVGSSPFGLLLQNNTQNLNLSSSLINYNNTYGFGVSSNHIGTISNITNTYNTSAGVYVDGNIPNLSATTFSNITASNGKSLGFVVSGNNTNYLNPITLNINGLVANDNLSGGFEGYNISGNLSSLELNRNGFYGMKTSIGNAPTTIDGITALMNNVSTASAGIGILSGYNYYPTLIKNANVGKSVGSSSFGAGISLDSTKFSQFLLYNSIISGGSSDFRLLATRGVIEGSYLISNTNIGNLPVGAGVTNSNYQSDVLKTAGFAFTNMNNASGYNVTYLAAGTRQIDSTVNITAGTAPSERLTPQSNTLKIRSGSKFVALSSGEFTTVSVYVRKSTVASNGVAYNGNSPRLILKRNAAMGINSDVVIDQLDTTSENFLKLYGTTQTVTDSGVLEFYVDCDGTQGFINIDNWTAN